jgi:hypothetical protein
MRLQNKKTLFAASGLAIAMAVVGSISMPTSTAAFTFIGGTLSLSQRDFRVFNNFTDSQANNNTAPHSNFPGHTGAVMAIWKGCAEWASVPRAGNGLGDGVGSNPIIGSGGANFDPDMQGTTGSIGGTNDNVHSEISSGGGSTLAYTETPISNGWRIRYISAWTWHDGPNNVTSGIDLQGVATHEYGHALGLGHTGSGGATMTPGISGTGVAARSIASDDIAGVQALYGVIAGGKPKIDSLSGSFSIGQTLTISGSGFSTTGNVVWFNKVNSNGVAVKVTGVSSTGGGTQINVTIPTNVEDGEVLVKDSGSGASALSNAFPIDIGAPAGDPPFLVSVTPNSGPAGGFTMVNLSGSGFTGVNSVEFGGVDALSFVVNSGSSIDAVAPAGAVFNSVDVAIVDPEGASTLPFAYFYNVNPTPSVDTISPSLGPTAGGTVVSISGSSVVGVTSVTFGGVSGVNLQINSATSLTVDSPPGSFGVVDVVVVGTGSDTLVGGFTYIDTGSFVNVGASGLPGIIGEPVFSGSGDLSPGSGTGFTLSLTNGFPLTTALLWVSVGDELPTPFKGGTLYTIPIVLEIGLSTDFAGNLSLPALMPASVPSGARFTMQFLVVDNFAPTFLGFSVSNGLKAIVP